LPSRLSDPEIEAFLRQRRHAEVRNLNELDRPRMQASVPAMFRVLDTARQVDVSTSTGNGGWGVDGTAPHPTWRAALLEPR